jgi:hypothetical protein
MEGYKTSIIQIPDLPESTIKEMVRIYLDHYDGSDEVRFRGDLAKKSEALLVHHSDRLVGFTLYQLYREQWLGDPIQVIYSGDTIVERAHWGQQALAFSWIDRAGWIKRQQPELPLYWFLIVKGHRTYRYLQSFSHSFHPRWKDAPKQLKSLADKLAQEKFGPAYNPDTGVIAFPESRGHLKQDIALPTAREKTKEAVSFFLRRNPGYLQGNELVCLCELSEENLKPLARRLFKGSR